MLRPASYIISICHRVLAEGKVRASYCSSGPILTFWKGPAFLPSEHDELPPGVAFMVLSYFLEFRL